MADKVLVTYSSKHGATAEIAARIGDTLKDAGLDVEVTDIKQAGDPSIFKAVVLGSAAYMGRWRSDAVKYLKTNTSKLSGIPVWLFMSGPSGKGDPTELLKGVIYPPGLKPTIDAINPRDVKPFHGDTSASRFSGWEKWIMKRVGADAADFRDWAVITEWARKIAAELKSV